MRSEPAAVQGSTVMPMPEATMWRTGFERRPLHALLQRVIRSGRLTVIRTSVQYLVAETMSDL